MRRFILCCLTLNLSFAVFARERLQEINVILHDQSFVAEFGRLPDASTTEQLRIRTHLIYTEKLLRAASTESLTPLQRSNRYFILGLLDRYLREGNFPINKDYPGERKPCFIDATGNICAVGYLVEQTKGRNVAEAINRQHQYDFILDMHEQTLEDWAVEFGLTLEECAMIQPTYGSQLYPETIYADIKTGYSVSSAFIAGWNIATDFVNLSSKSNHRNLSYIGLATGTAQVILGLANLRKPGVLYRINSEPVTISYKSQNILSSLNIAIGTATIVTSAFNLAMSRKKTGKKNAFNLFGYPGDNHSLAMGVIFTRAI